LTLSPPFDTAYRLIPGIQHYAWGDRHFVPDLLGIPNPDNIPHAEVWMGAHPALPARLSLAERELRFDELLAAHGPAFLGSGVAETFEGLPYLLKILAAAEPLSIQVHPTKTQAEDGFRREDASGVPRDAPHRSYRDANHKPEVLVALTPFHALAGFRPLHEIGTVLDGFGELTGLLPPFVPTPDGLRAVVEAYLALPDDDLHPALARLVERLRQEDARRPREIDDPVYWMLEADEVFSQAGYPDRGLLFVMLLELVRLEPGQALYQRAGTLHAYLRGAGVELMANSDNVVRAGLTPKHVDTGEVLRIVDFVGTGLTRVDAVAEQTPGERVYRTPSQEFRLSELIVSRDSTVNAVARGADTLVVTGGDPDITVRVTASDGRLELPRGAVAVVPHGIHYTVAATGPATVFRATVPVESDAPGR
jgi:mannose-6-phosphate isomerase class I